MAYDRIEQLPESVRSNLPKGAQLDHLEAGSKRALGWYLSLQVGLDAACRLAKEHRPSRVIVQSNDGRIATEYTFEPI